MLKSVLTILAIIIFILSGYVYLDTKKTNSKIITTTSENKVITKPNLDLDKNTLPTKIDYNETIAEEKVNNKIKHTISNKKEIIIGQNITPEDIQNSDVSIEEKQRMRDDMLYFQSLEREKSPNIKRVQTLDIILKDLQDSNIN